jgi:hypothetical protein
VLCLTTRANSDPESVKPDDENNEPHALNRRHTVQVKDGPDLLGSLNDSLEKVNGFASPFIGKLIGALRLSQGSPGQMAKGQPLHPDPGDCRFAT